MSLAWPGISAQHRSARLFTAAAVAATLPGVVMALLDAHPAAPLQAAVYGVAIIGAAFLLSWAAEAAQVDISAGLAIAVLALIAVLPEYAVDFVFTSRGGGDYAQFGPACAAAGSSGETNCALALANMTGANRILVGIGWSMVVLLSVYRLRGRRTLPGAVPVVGATTEGGRGRVQLPRTEAVPVAYLLLACLYALTLPLKDRVTLIDAVVLVGIFVGYTLRILKAPTSEPHLVGPAAWVGTMPTARRRSTYGLFMVAAAVVIVLTAHRFADALVDTGTEFGISQFFLVQWLAPLASEAPELLIAGLFAWRLNTAAALGTLISSKVNQWTLLVSTLPLVFTVAVATAEGPFSGTLSGLPVDAAQRDELLLTAAQSLFAVSLLVGLTIGSRQAFALLGLFLAQFVTSFAFPDSWQNATILAFSAVYLLAALALFYRHRSQLRSLLRDGFRTSYQEMTAEPAVR